jgi:hypothetical protein
MYYPGNVIKNNRIYPMVLLHKAQFFYYKIVT